MTSRAGGPASRAGRRGPERAQAQGRGRERRGRAWAAYARRPPRARGPRRGPEEAPQAEGRGGRGGGRPGRGEHPKPKCHHRNTRGRCSERSATTAAARRVGSTSQEHHLVKAAACRGTEERIARPYEEVEALRGVGVIGLQAIGGAVATITDRAVDQPRRCSGSDIPGTVSALQREPPFCPAVKARAAELMTA